MSSPSLRDRLWQLIDWLHGFRYIRFGIVGASGTVVNLIVLYVCQEQLFRFIEVDRSRLYASMAVGIAVSTVNNFTWNRLWTWSDRHHSTTVQEGVRLKKRSLLAQLGQYATASWIGIGLQYVLALWLAHYLPYLLSTVIAIAIASVSNFITNDRWTFRHKKGKDEGHDPSA
jgi:dolichol-phosphate mannosyltransferase